MENKSEETWNTPKSSIPTFKVDPIVVLILSLLTCGLYLIYWNLKASEVLNAVAEREIISNPIAIFAGCCYPINCYFFYLAGKEGLPAIQRRLGYQVKDDSLLYLILGLFFPMVAAMILQNEINKLY
ncbi:DUF4234 domain-containing protein [Flavobacterium sp. HJJ]|uniref:DUF4234 domain-containing protein n=1 Tax=Flavobacterium sp. HJJ TaxID=2783792 RepID=UPI00188AE64F|nr:DUF4234 domain-containing protein [Flavobacterium sp. HJJ]MBF4472687.1 DUF4234 domain-containing protein [Flavobacterium sp. HJJ]